MWVLNTNSLIGRIAVCYYSDCVFDVAKRRVHMRKATQCLHDLLEEAPPGLHESGDIHS